MYIIISIHIFTIFSLAVSEPPQQPNYFRKKKQKTKGSDPEDIDQILGMQQRQMDEIVRAATTPPDTRNVNFFKYIMSRAANYTKDQQRQLEKIILQTCDAIEGINDGDSAHHQNLENS